jgi:hypothetical protein
VEVFSIMIFTHVCIFYYLFREFSNDAYVRVKPSYKKKSFVAREKMTSTSMHLAVCISYVFIEDFFIAHISGCIIHIMHIVVAITV